MIKFFNLRNEIVLFVASLCFTFLMGELASRIWLSVFATKDQFHQYSLYTEIPGREWQLSPHPYLIYYPTPYYKNGDLSHNSLGYRGDEFSVQKPKGVYRIVLLGESSTYDIKIHDNTKTFAARLQDILQKKYNYKNVQVINAGVPGYNSWESLVNFEFRVLDLSPDMVIVYHGANDVHARLVVPASYRGDDSGRRKPWALPAIPLWQRSCILRIMAHRMGLWHQVNLEKVTTAPTSIYFENDSDEDSDKIIGVLKENPPIYFQRNLENMIAIAKENKIQIMLATWAYSPYFNDYAASRHYQYGFKENNDVVRKVARNQDVLLFDFEKRMPQDSKYWADGRHSNELGAQKKAELFAEFIEQQKVIRN